MAQTNRKRRRKHRGTQAGTIEARGRTGRSSGRTTTPARGGRGGAGQARPNRLDREPTWRGALNRSLIAAVGLAIVWSIVNKNVAAGIVIGVVVLAFYVPMTYFIDGAMYRRRQRRKQSRR